MSSDYPDWQPAIDAIVQDGGTLMLLGATDCGKTTLCAQFVNAALAAGRRVAVVDGDIGQSEIGPPACVGMGLPTTPVRALGEIAPAALAFVGTTAPRGSLVEHVVALRRMADAALASLPAPDLLLVDTTGYVQGPAAVRLKQAKLALLAPRHVVAVQRRAELEPILAPLRYREDVRVHRLPVPEAITRKSPALRAQRRAARFARCFEGAELRTFDFDRTVFTGTWLNMAQPVAPHLLTFIANALHARAYYAEEHERHLGIVTGPLPSGGAAEPGLATVQEHFRAQAITVTPASRLRHLLVGLSDGSDRLLGLGLIEALDLRRRQLGVLTSIRAPGAVQLIHFGLLRLDAGGKELLTNRPGDV